MQHALTYSISEHIRGEFPQLTEVIWMRDGIELSTKTRPFAVVKFMDDEAEPTATGRDHFTETYTFQIGLHGTEFGLPRENEQLKTALRKEIPFIDTRTTEAPVTGSFYLDGVSFTNVPWSSGLNHESDRWRVEVDCEVNLYRENGAYQFTY
jgi:hypothetical protein